MKIKFQRIDGKYWDTIIVFKDEDTASKWSWLFHRLLRMYGCCAGGFMNAYCWK